ncbi:hypothetical protein AB0B48_24505 [Micromonospora sp. NPDC049089]|uniref:hypothetical protein n=1 Tax=Micromonospora sp. NPDC049089 TaxID=3155496 RepID=UPI0034004ADE
MIRPTWTPTDEQNAAIEQAKQVWAAAKTAEDAAWKATQALRDADIPDLAICERIEQVSKPTLNRRLGPRKSRRPQES